MKREKQINETKELITEAYMALLEIKEEKEITLTEIAHKAGVGRMTLYRHFKEKEDILLFKIELSYKKAKVYLNNDILNLSDLMIFRFKLLKESPNIMILQKMNRLQKTFDIFRKIYSDDIKRNIPTGIDSYETVFIMGGLDAMTHLWIDTGMKDSYHEMAKKALQLIQKHTLNNRSKEPLDTI